MVYKYANKVAQIFSDAFDFLFEPDRDAPPAPAAASSKSLRRPKRDHANRETPAARRKIHQQVRPTGCVKVVRRAPSRIAIRGRRGKETGWFVPGKVERGLELSLLPQNAIPSWSADGVRLAWYGASEPDKGMFIDSSGEQKKYENPGGDITGLV